MFLGIVKNKDQLSGKSSPIVSGHNSPCPTIEENKLSIISPSKVKSKNLDFNFPFNKSSGKRANPQLDEVRTTEDKEKQFERMLKDTYWNKEEEVEVLQRPKSLSLENLNEIIESSAEGFDFFNSRGMVRNGKVVFDNCSQTEGLIEDHLTWLDYLIKYCGHKIEEASEIEDSGMTSNNNTANGQEQQTCHEKCEMNIQSTENFKETISKKKPPMKDWNEEMLEDELQENEIHIKEDSNPTVQKLEIDGKSDQIKSSENPIVNSKKLCEDSGKNEENNENVNPNSGIKKTSEILNNNNNNNEESKQIICGNSVILSEKHSENLEVSEALLDNSKYCEKSEMSEEKFDDTVKLCNNLEHSTKNPENAEITLQKNLAKETYSQKVSGGAAMKTSKTSISAVTKTTVPSMASNPGPSNPLKRPLSSTIVKPTAKPLGQTGRQFYSLRNQMIPSAAKRVPPNPTAPKRTSFSSTINRNSIISRSSSYTNQKNIPATGKTTVLNNAKNGDKTRSKFPVRSKTMIEIPNKNSLVNHSQKLLQKSYKEESDSSTSTLKASIEKLGSKNSVVERKYKKSNERLENDGWLTVKTKRRSSLHWSTRFDQPSSSTSLPSLTHLNENSEDIPKEPVKVSNKNDKTSETTNGKIKAKPKTETRTVVARNPSATLHKSKTTLAPSTLRSRASANRTVRVSNNNQQNSGNNKVANKTTTSSSNSANEKSFRENIILRQKSDLTGLKIKSLRREYFRSAKNQNTRTLLEEEPDKVEKNIQTSLVTIDPDFDLNDKKNFNGDFSSCDELEEKEETESDDDQKKLLEEQESLERQIRELENTEIDVDTETETDCEAIIDFEDNESSTETNDLTDIEQNEDLELRYAPMLQEMSCSERTEILQTLQSLVARYPGRAQKLHQKLSSPSRSRSFHETLKKYQEKQTRAEEKRQELQQKKALKIQQLLARVEDVKLAKQQLIDNKRQRMEDRLKRAAENRDQYLKNKVKKAHDEEEKLKEIAFIKNILKENKRIEFIESCKENEVRLQDLEQERIKKAEEKAAKEAAVERRRLELEMQRLKKLERLNETRREREQRVGKMQEQREKLRQEMAKEKQRDRDMRLQMLQKQQLQGVQDLQKRIAQKQQESARRHEENIEHIRQKALELASQRNPDDVKTVVEEEENLNIGVRTKEIIKLGKKKMKKIKQKYVDM